MAKSAYSIGDEVRLERTVEEFSAGTICVVRGLETDPEVQLLVETRSPTSVMRHDVKHNEDEVSSRSVFTGRTKYRTFSVSPNDVIRWNR